MTLKDIWRSFHSRLSFQQSLAGFCVARCLSNSWASCYIYCKCLFSLWKIELPNLFCVYARHCLKIFLFNTCFIPPNWLLLQHFSNFCRGLLIIMIIITYVCRFAGLVDIVVYYWPWCVYVLGYIQSSQATWLVMMRHHAPVCAQIYTLTGSVPAVN